MAETTPQKTWRVLDLINWTTKYLQEKGFPSPRSDVEWLLMDVLNCSRVDLYTDFEKPVKQSELGIFKTLLKRRLAHEPVQYIIGETEFMGFPFQVNESVLIPRPETEILVEKAVDWLRKQPKTFYRVIDIGAGSGCLGVSLARLAPHLELTLVDISEDALNVARKNARINKVTEQITCRQMDILTETPTEKFDLIVSNPPYIAVKELEHLQNDIQKFEPRTALVAGENGLIFYRRYAEFAKGWLVENGKIFLEIGGTHQSKSVMNLFRGNNWSEISLHKDYADQDRLLIAAP